MDAVVLCEPKFGAGPIQSAIDYLVVEKRYRVVGAALIAKEPRPDFALEVPVVAAPDAAAAVRLAAEKFHPRAVVDITESPLEERFRWANEALRLGLEVHGADFRLWPPVAHEMAGRPTVMFIGAGTAVGKSAAIINFVHEARGRYRAAALVMDLGGPSYPELVEPSAPEAAADRLYAYLRDGRRIDGDHYLLAAAAGVPAVGCSFAGSGLTGVPLASVVGDGAVLAAETGAELFLVEGSGQVIPPVAAGAVCLLMNIQTEPAALRGFPFAYQLQRADVVVATGFKNQPHPKYFERLQQEVKAANPRAAFTYAPLAAELVAPPPVENAIAVTTRPEGACGALARRWGVRLRGQVLRVLCAQHLPPRATITKLVKTAPPATGLLLDMSLPALADWLEFAYSWGLPVGLTYEVLKPARPFYKTLLKRALEAAA